VFGFRLWLGRVPIKSSAMSASVRERPTSSVAAKRPDGPATDVASQIFSVWVDAEPNDALDRHRLNAPNGLGRWSVQSRDWSSVSTVSRSAPRLQNQSQHCH